MLVLGSVYFSLIFYFFKVRLRVAKWRHGFLVEGYVWERFCCCLTSYRKAASS